MRQSTGIQLRSIEIILDLRLYEKGLVTVALVIGMPRLILKRFYLGEAHDRE